MFISRRQKRVTPSISVEEGSPTAEPITEITPGNTPEKKGKYHINIGEGGDIWLFIILVPKVLQ